MAERSLGVSGQADVPTVCLAAHPFLLCRIRVTIVYTTFVAMPAEVVLLGRVGPQLALGVSAAGVLTALISAIGYLLLLGHVRVKAHCAPIDPLERLARCQERFVAAWVAAHTVAILLTGGLAGLSWAVF